MFGQPFFMEVFDVDSGVPGNPDYAQKVSPANVIVYDMAVTTHDGREWIYIGTNQGLYSYRPDT